MKSLVTVALGGAEREGVPFTILWLKRRTALLERRDCSGPETPPVGAHGMWGQWAGCSVGFLFPAGRRACAEEFSWLKGLGESGPRQRAEGTQSWLCDVERPSVYLGAQ